MRYFSLMMAALLVLGMSSVALGGPLDRNSADYRVNPSADSMLRVPGVVGMRTREALFILQQAGLSPRVNRIESKKPELKGQEGRVIEQIPAAGGVAMLGSSITLRIYQPPGCDDIPLPSPHQHTSHWGEVPPSDISAPPTDSVEEVTADSSEGESSRGWSPSPEAPTDAAELPDTSPPEPAAAEDDSLSPGEGASDSSVARQDANAAEPASPPDSEQAPHPSATPTNVPVVVHPAPITVQFHDPAVPESPGGRFRIVATGFRVNHETWDHALNADGCGDEIVVLGTAMEIDSTGRVTQRNERKTPVMGDINHFPERIRAGRGACFSFDPPKGGLKTGDQFPGEEPWRMNGTPRNDRLPLVLWEGNLVEGENAVLVVPTLWEYDNRGDILSQYQDIFKSIGELAVESEPAQLLRYLGQRIVRGAETLGFSFDGIRTGIEDMKKSVNNSVGVAVHRPIGMTKKGMDYVQIPPQTLAFTYSSAKELLRTRQGQISERFQDHPDLKGDYTLYLVVEEIP